MVVLRRSRGGQEVPQGEYADRHRHLLGFGFADSAERRPSAGSVLPAVPAESDPRFGRGGQRDAVFPEEGDPSEGQRVPGGSRETSDPAGGHPKGGRASVPVTRRRHVPENLWGARRLLGSRGHGRLRPISFSELVAGVRTGDQNKREDKGHPVIEPFVKRSRLARSADGFSFGTEILSWHTFRRAYRTFARRDLEQRSLTKTVNVVI